MKRNETAELVGQAYFHLVNAHQLMRDAIPHIPPAIASAFEEELAKVGLRLAWRERRFEKEEKP